MDPWHNQLTGLRPEAQRFWRFSIPRQSKKSLDRPPAKAAVQDDCRASETQADDPIAFFG
jgi:hypothetical protein